MNKLNILMVALVAIIGLSSCEKHNCDDHTADLAGTWTYISQGYAEALVISADGSVVSTGVEGDEYWENVKGNIVTEDGKVIMTFEDNDNFEGHFDIIPGEAFSIYSEEGERMTYRYCKEDLSEKITGMWLFRMNLESVQKTLQFIYNFNANGTVDRTGAAYDYSGNINDSSLHGTDPYKLVGDMLVMKSMSGTSDYMVFRLEYKPNDPNFGEIIVCNYEAPSGKTLECQMMKLNQSLNLAGKKYDYSNLYITNVKGLDKEIDFLGFKFNFGKMDGSRLDKMLKTLLFTIEFPDAKNIKYTLHHYNIGPSSLEAPIAVDGNKMTIKMSETYPAVKDVDFYTFQDADGCQLHMYMPTNSVVNFFANMQVIMMSQLKELDLTDAAAVKAVYDTIDEAVESINLSLVLKNNTKSL